MRAWWVERAWDYCEGMANVEDSLPTTTRQPSMERRYGD